MPTRSGRRRPPDDTNQPHGQLQSPTRQSPRRMHQSPNPAAAGPAPSVPLSPRTPVTRSASYLKGVFTPFGALNLEGDPNVLSNEPLWNEIFEIISELAEVISHHAGHLGSELKKTRESLATTIVLNYKNFGDEKGSIFESYGQVWNIMQLINDYKPTAIFAEHEISTYYAVLNKALTLLNTKAKSPEYSSHLGTWLYVFLGDRYTSHSASFESVAPQATLPPLSGGEFWSDVDAEIARLYPGAAIPKKERTSQRKYIGFKNFISKLISQPNYKEVAFLRARIALIAFRAQYYLCQHIEYVKQESVDERGQSDRPEAHYKVPQAFVINDFKRSTFYISNESYTDKANELLNWHKYNNSLPDLVNFPDIKQWLGSYGVPAIWQSSIARFVTQHGMAGFATTWGITLCGRNTAFTVTPDVDSTLTFIYVNTTEKVVTLITHLHLQRLNYGKEIVNFCPKIPFVVSCQIDISRQPFQPDGETDIRAITKAQCAVLAESLHYEAHPDSAPLNKVNILFHPSRTTRQTPEVLEDLKSIWPLKLVSW